MSESLRRQVERLRRDMHAQTLDPDEAKAINRVVMAGEPVPAWWSPEAAEYAHRAVGFLEAIDATEVDELPA